MPNSPAIAAPVHDDRPTAPRIDSAPRDGGGMVNPVEITTDSRVKVSGTLREWAVVITVLFTTIGGGVVAYAGYHDLKRDVQDLAEQRREDNQSREKLADSVNRLAVAVGRLEGTVGERAVDRLGGGK